MTRGPSTPHARHALPSSRVPFRPGRPARRMGVVLTVFAATFATPLLTSAATVRTPTPPSAATVSNLATGSNLASAAAATVSRPTSSAAATGSRPALSAAFGTSINSTDDVRRVSAMLNRPLSTVRVFLGGVPSAWSNNAVLATIPATGTVALSFHSGTPTQLKQFLSGRPKTLTCYVTYFHEPEDNLKSASEKAAYRARWRAYAPAIRQAGCKPTLILMKWSLNPHSGRHWRDWYPQGDVDVLAFDAYNTRAKHGTYGTPSKYLAPILAVSKETGLPWALTEISSDIPSGTSSAQRAAWARGVAVAAAAEPGFLFACWWDVLSNGGRDYRLDRAAALAWRP